MIKSLTFSLLFAVASVSRLNATEKDILPEALQHLPSENIIDISPSIYVVSNLHTSVLCQDPEDSSRQIAVYTPAASTKASGRVSMGVIDQQRWKTQKKVVAWSGYTPADENYHWYKIKAVDDGRLGPDSHFYLENWSLGARCNGHTGIFDYWIRVKAEGPHFVAGSNKKNRLILQRALMVRKPVPDTSSSPDRQAKKMPSSTLSASEKTGKKATTTATGNLSALTDIIFSAHVNGHPAPVPKGAAAKITSQGIVMNYVFPSRGHDACMVEFPVSQKKFSELSVRLTASQAGHRPFIVLTDKNGEKHYFSLIATDLIPGQCLNKAGLHTLGIPVPLDNSPHTEQRFAWRWGGDDNQRIDFPVTAVTLGLNDYPDPFQGRGTIIFHSLIFK